METISRADTPPVPTSGWKAWDDKILQSPWPIEYQLAPIWKAIKNAEKRNNMIKALELFFESSTTPNNEPAEGVDETCVAAATDTNTVGTNVSCCVECHLMVVLIFFFIQFSIII